MTYLLQEQLAKRDAEMVLSFLFTLGCNCFRIRGSGLFIGPYRLGARPDDPNVKWLNKSSHNRLEILLLAELPLLEVELYLN